MDVDASIEERLDEAYVRLGSADASHGPGYANHGPMAAEALVAMGGHRHLRAFVESYAPRLVQRPAPARPIDDAVGALGARSEFADWAQYFADEIAASNWSEVVRAWLPRLVPGFAAAAGHGPLRVAHVLRALERHDSEVRRTELADALGYWAATFTVLGGADPVGTEELGEAIAGLPRLAQGHDRQGSITPLLHEATTQDGWNTATAALVPADDPAARLDQLARASIDAYLAYTPHSFTFLHGVTAPTMARALLSHLGLDDQRVLVEAAWRYVAAAIGAFAPHEGLGEMAGPRPGRPTGRAGMVDLAGGTRDDHTIKFVDSCLTLAARLGDAAPLAAADDRIARTS